MENDIDEEESTVARENQGRKNSLKERIMTSTSQPSTSKNGSIPNDGNNNRKSKDVSGGLMGSSLNSKLKDEYINSLQCWMATCYYWKAYQSMLASAIMNSPTLANAPASESSESTSSSATSSENESTDSFGLTGIVYKLPPIWKRVAAELIDFFLLLLMKIFVTFIAIDYLDLVDLKKFEIPSFDLNEIDAYQIAIDISSEILVIETVHRIIVIVYETIFLMQNIAFTSPTGGSTPGKKIMKLRVVTCETVQDLPNNRIKVTPAGNIGFVYSLLRAVIKNFSSLFFLPASLTIFVSVHNRSAYDVACKCIVVEDTSRRR